MDKIKFTLKSAQLEEAKKRLEQSRAEIKESALALRLANNLASQGDVTLVLRVYPEKDNPVAYLTYSIPGEDGSHIAKGATPVEALQNLLEWAYTTVEKI